MAKRYRNQKCFWLHFDKKPLHLKVSHLGKRPPYTPNGLSCTSHYICIILFFLLLLIRGRFCEDEIDECLSSPCANGANCVNEVGDFRCDCLPGFNGKLCDNNIDECSIFGVSPCLNGGRCVDGIADFNCFCTPGFDGKKCENGEQALSICKCK